MPDPIKDAADAANRVMDFMRKHYSFPRPVRADREGAWWIVDVDVGATKPNLIRVRVNTHNGEIENFATVGEGKA